MHSSDPKLKQRLNRIAGQVAGLQKMLDEDRYCVDVLTQISAVRSALDALAVAVLCGHVDHCLTAGGERAHPRAKGRTKDELIAELQAALGRLVK